jgi:hypothetical protein
MAPIITDHEKDNFGLRALVLHDDALNSLLASVVVNYQFVRTRSLRCGNLWVALAEDRRGDFLWRRALLGRHDHVTGWDPCRVYR